MRHESSATQVTNLSQGKPAGLPAQPPVTMYHTPFDTQTYTAVCCQVKEESIFDEFDDEELRSFNTVHVGDKWIEQQGQTIYETLFGCRASLCVIKDNVGGGLMEFALAAKAASYMKMRFVVDGTCSSACALFADIARARVCIGPEAHLGFHKWARVAWAEGPDGRIPLSTTYYEPRENEDLLDLVRANGGFPEKGMNFLPFSAALTIWWSCPNYH
jgi:hypothetical protein